MKSSIKVISLLISMVIGSVIYYNSGKLKFDDNIELKQAPLDITSLQSGDNPAIWSVKTDSNLVCFSITFRNEGDRAFQKTPGLLDLTLNTILEGAGKYDSIELKKLMTDNSISISFGSSKDTLTLTCSCLHQYFNITIDLLCEVLTKAQFNNEKLEVTKQGLIVSIKQELFSPNSVARDKLNELIFPEEHPYRSSLSSILKALPDYKREDVLKCYNQLFAMKNAEVTIVSNLSADEINNGFDKIFQILKSKKNGFEDIDNKYDINIKPGKTHVELDNPQSSVLFILPGVDKKSKDYFAVSIANSIFGEVGLISRLAKSVRDNNGLVYRIQSNINCLDGCSYILGNADTRPENVENVIQKVKAEYKRFYEEGITEKEFEMAKTRKFSQNIFDSNSSILGFILRIRDLGLDDINKVNGYLNNYQNLTVQDINAVIKKVFNPENLLFIDCGKSISKGETK